MQGVSNPVKDVYIIKVDTGDVIIHTGDLAETTLKSYIIPGGTIGANGSIRVKATGVSRGNNNQKSYWLKFGGVVIEAILVDPQIGGRSWTLFSACHNLGAENSQNWSVLWLDVNLVLNIADEERAIDTSVDQILEITCKVDDVADSGEIRDWTVEIRPVS